MLVLQPIDSLYQPKEMGVRSQKLGIGRLRDPEAGAFFSSLSALSRLSGWPNGKNDICFTTSFPKTGLFSDFQAKARLSEMCSPKSAKIGLSSDALFVERNPRLDRFRG